MSEWWTYRPRDLLMFTPDTYWHLFERHNQAAWPLPLLLPLLAVLWLLWWWRRPAGAALQGGLAALALALAAVAWCFLWRLYEPINWAASAFAWLFAGLAALVLALLALLAATFRERLSIAAPGPRHTAGAWLVAAAAVVYPLLAPAAGRPWMQAEVIGLAPEPTVIALLGLLLVLRAGTVLAQALLVLAWLGALAWCVLASSTLWTMGSAQGAAPAAAAAFALLVLLVVRARMAPRAAAAGR